MADETQQETGAPAWKPKDAYRLVEHENAPTTVVQDFERAFEKALGVKHAVLVNSSGAAMQLSWFLAFQQPNRRVVVPAVSSPAAVMPAIQLGFGPVLCEVDAASWGLEPKSLTRICESEKGSPSVVVVSHVLGMPPAGVALAQLKEEHGFMVIEDARESIDAAAILALGDVAAMEVGSAGVILTNDDEYHGLLLLFRGRGDASDLDEESRAKLAGAMSKRNPFFEQETYFVPGFDFRPSPLQAQAGLAFLARLPDVGAARARNHGIYFSRFGGAKDFYVPRISDANPIASSGFGVLASTGAHRTKVVEALRAKGIQTRPVGAGYIGRQPFWIAGYQEPTRERPVAERIHERGFVLPNHAGLSEQDVGYISEVVLAVAP